MTTAENKTLGDFLKDTRTGRRIPLKKVFEDTYMPVKFIEMIENGRWSELPSEAHLKGYIRLYSSYLKIDPAVIDEYLAGIMPAEKEANRDNPGSNGGAEKEGAVLFSPSERKTMCLLLMLSAVFIIILFLILYLLPE